MPAQVKKKRRIGLEISSYVLLFAIYYLYKGIYEASISSGMTFAGIALAVVIGFGFAMYAISTALEDPTDKK